jgi:DNA-binding NtrC family response regulator
MTQAAFEKLRPTQTSRTVLPKPSGVRTDIELHIQALSELVNVLLTQIEMLQSEPKHCDDLRNLSLREKVRRFEIELIEHALALTRGNQLRAAKFLGANATTLNEKIKRYQLQLPNMANRMPSQFRKPNKESCEGV